MPDNISAPIDIQWELTPWCTYNCVQCYNYWRRGAPPLRCLNDSQLAIHSKTISEVLANKVFHITLTGGEPLGVLHQMYGDLLVLKNAGVGMNMNTNLALLNEELVQMLKELGIRSLLTSLMSSDQQLNDTLAQQPGAFKRTVAGIRLAVSSGFHVSVNMAVMQQNFNTIYSTGELAHSLGATGFCATKATKPSNCPDFTGYQLNIDQVRAMFQTLLSIKKAFGINVASLEHYPACIFEDSESRTAFGTRNCTAARTSCTIGFDGGVRPCSHAPMSYGNVTEGLSKAWEAMSDWRDDSIIPSVCLKDCCEAPMHCGGGCRIEALNAAGSISKVDPYSLNHKPSARMVTSRSVDTSADAAVRLSKAVLFRPEVFGYIAFRSSNRWLALNKRLYDILNTTKEEGRLITARDIAFVFDCPETAALETLKLLRKKGIVEII